MSKFFKYDEFKDLKFNGGTMDYHNLRGCYLEMTGHFDIQEEIPHSLIKKVINRTNSTIHRHLMDSVFREKFITTPTIPFTFNERNGGFVSVEYTFYPKKSIDYKELKIELQKIATLVNEIVVSEDKMNIIKNKSKKPRKNEKN